MKTSYRRAAVLVLALAALGILLSQYQNLGSDEQPPVDQTATLPDNTGLPENTGPSRKGGTIITDPQGADDVRPSVPDRFDRPQDQLVQVSDYAAEISDLDEDSRAYVERFNERFNGALDYGSPGEKAWQDRRGYPSIDDVLYAQGLTEEALLEWARTGDPVGILLHYARRLDEAVYYMEANDVHRPNFVEAYICHQQPICRFSGICF